MSQSRSIGAAAAALTAAASSSVTGRSPVGMLLFRGRSTDGAVGGVHVRLLDGVALAAVATSIATLILTEGVVVSVAAWLTLLFGPVAAFQKRKLAGLGTFRGQHNALREKVNDLTLENDRLGRNVDRLEMSVSQIEEVERDLAKLANTDNVDRLVNIVKEQKDITRQMKENLKARILHDVVEVVIRNDRDGDFIIGPREMERMILCLDQLEGVGFREDRFRSMLGKKKRYTLGNIMALLRNLLDDDVPEEENVFLIKPEELKK